MQICIENYIIMMSNGFYLRKGMPINIYKMILLLLVFLYVKIISEKSECN